MVDKARAGRKARPGKGGFSRPRPEGRFREPNCRSLTQPGKDKRPGKARARPGKVGREAGGQGQAREDSTNHGPDSTNHGPLDTSLGGLGL